MIYVAVPYSHDDPTVKDFRFRAATLYTAYLYKQRKLTYSPITHGHPMSVLDQSMPKTWEFWREMDFHYLRRCDELHVFQLPGWETSVGVTEEINLAKLLNIHTLFVTPHEQLVENAKKTMAFI